MDHRAIILLAEAVDEAYAFIHRAMTLKGHDGRTVLERMAAERQDALRAARYDLSSAASHVADIDDPDPEARTPPPGYSDPTGERVAQGRRDSAEKDAKSVAHKLGMAEKLTRELFVIFNKYPDPHKPTQEELRLYRDTERENRTDNCQSCQRVSEDVISTAVAQVGSESWRLCEFCAGHLLTSDSLPTRQALTDHHHPPRRVSA